MTEIKLSNVLILILINFIYVYILKVIKCLRIYKKNKKQKHYSEIPSSFQIYFKNI